MGRYSDRYHPKRERFVSSREVENIFENSDFVYMLNQAQGDREILAKQLNISQQQMTYVTHSDAGEGLIFYGNVICPLLTVSRKIRNSIV